MNSRYYLAGFFFCCLSTILTSSFCHAEIYKWRDKNGQLHFGDKPPGEVNSQKVKVKINSYANVEVVNGDEWASQRDQKNNKRVIIYSTTWCGVCKKAKRYFAKKRIPFTDYDVEHSEKGKRDYAQMKATGVPVILVGKQRINGFNPARFEAIYNKSKSKTSQQRK